MPMNIDILQVDIDAGKASITDDSGNTLTYRLKGVAPGNPAIHVRFLPLGPPAATFALLQLETFPKVLFIHQPEPGGMAARPGRVGEAWEGIFEYLPV
jgi:hypothetical protein